MELLQAFLTVTVVHLLAAASPGPDFVMVSQQSLVHGRRAGLLCSLGIALGLSVHIVYSSIGMASLMSQSSGLLWVIKYLAAAYLIYLGIKGLRSRAASSTSEAPGEVLRRSAWKLVSMGFLCNAINPKAPLYFLSVFSLVLTPDMPPLQLAALGLWMMLLQFGWFSSVALLLSWPAVKRRFLRIGHWVDRVLGMVMLGFGLRLLFSRTN
ncbi:LysE family translocator [Halomonas caseinilytica]|uniref:Resistance to homoserine/threonine (RhtB) family protein n=1 Tax=Halomonas caseinilytica TaxID=438744 RepID=A0A1M6XQ36_9GAMM|nr:LysE family transporter [Halomonas caseinilytica]SHL08023.1 resistance to homoserine/threonine (RhtB) family protein [Halomonas caseinilytica]